MVHVITCSVCKIDSVGLYCTTCCARKINKVAGDEGSNLVEGRDPIMRTAPKRFDPGAPPTWTEIREQTLEFLNKDLALTERVVERPNGVDWFTSGVKTSITAHSRSHDYLYTLVDICTHIANIRDERVGCEMAAFINTEIPMSICVWENDLLSLRCRFSLTATGRSFLDVIKVATLLQVDYAHEAKKTFVNSSELRASHPNDGSVLVNNHRNLFAAFKTITKGGGEWLYDAWNTIRLDIDKTMIGLGYPIGWGNHEVQHYNEMPPDIAVAVLKPADPRFIKLGAGATFIAKATSPHESINKIPKTVINQLNISMLNSEGSAIGPFRGDRGDIAGLRIEAWVPAAGLEQAKLSSHNAGVTLANIAAHIIIPAVSLADEFTK